jgi:ribose transport system permease protein
MSAVAGVMTSAKLGMSDSLAGTGDLFATLTAVVVGGTLLSGGQGGVLQSFVGVLITVVLANGMVQAGVDPVAQLGVQGFLIVCAVTLTQWPLRKRLAVVK